MAEITTITQLTQIGVEATPGTGVPANKLLQSVSWNIDPDGESKQYRAAGSKFPSLVVPTKEWSAGELVGGQTYTELVYLLASLLNYTAPVQIEGSTAAYRWTFSPSANAPDTVKTYSVEQGSSVRARKSVNNIITAMEFTYSRDGCDLSGQSIGKAVQDGIVMTSTPEAIPLVPIIPNQVSVYLADEPDDLDTANALPRALSVAWNMSNRFGPIYPLGSAYGPGFAATIETLPTTAARLKMAADADGMALLETLRDGATKFLRIEAIGPEFETGHNYSMIADLAVKVEKPVKSEDSDGLYALEWPFVVVYDADWGQALQIVIVNDLAGL